VLKYKIGFLPLYICLEKLAIVYVKKIYKGLVREYIKREYNTILAIIAY